MIAESIQAVDTFYVDVYAVKSTSRISYDDDEQRYCNIHPLNIIISITTLPPPCHIQSIPFPSIPSNSILTTDSIIIGFNCFKQGNYEPKKITILLNHVCYRMVSPFIPSFLHSSSPSSSYIYL